MEDQTTGDGNVSGRLDIDEDYAVLIDLISEQRVPFGASKGFPKKNINVPEGEPPRGYVCYRCGKKGEFAINPIVQIEADMTRSLDPSLPYQ